MKTLARIQLRRKPASGAKNVLNGYFSVAAGYDDNVTLDIENGVLSSKVADGFMEGLAAVSAQLTGSRENGIQVKGSGYALRYRDMDSYNFSSIGLRPEFDHRFGKWRTETGAGVDWLTFDNQLFETLVSGRIKGSRAINRSLTLQLQYKLSRIEAAQDFEYLTGIQHRFDVGLQTRIWGTNGRLGYRYELNDRKDATYPNRHAFLFSAYRAFDTDWTGELDGGFRLSNYNDISRNDQRIRLGLKISRRIPWQFNVFGKYVFTRNSSNLDAYEYSSNIILFGVERFFGF